MARGRRFCGGALVVAGLMTVGVPRAQAGSSPPTYVYFDQNEVLEFYQDGAPAYAGQSTTHLIPPWDPNGQMCVLPDGRFSSGYNPTGNEQTSNDAYKRPRKQPPVGIAIYDDHGIWTGQSLHLDGPYKLDETTSPKASATGVAGNPDASGDVPPDANHSFNNNGTFTGCVIDSLGNIIGGDLGTSQGQFPPDDDGRLIEYFASDGYTHGCIIYGPNSGGASNGSFPTHHVDGHGGLQQPGTLARDAQDNVYVPVDGSAQGAPNGQVLKFDHGTFPVDFAHCHNDDANGKSDNFHQAVFSVFIQTNPANQPFPSSIARDPVCGCWAVASVLGNPAIEWYDDSGTPVPPTVHAPVPEFYAGQNFSPYGMAFDPAGNLFVVDISIKIDAPGTITSQQFQAGPQDGQGRLLEFTFTNGAPNPAAVIASGENFPVSVTTCTPGPTQSCPVPAKAPIVPETPRTVLVLGAGILAIGGFALLRRRRGGTAAH